MKQNPFTLAYFLDGPYRNAKLSGIAQYLGKYYWARRFYAGLTRTITPKNGRILEIGCGFGDLLVFLERDFETYGSDISAAAIEEAKKRLQKTTLLLQDSEKMTHLKPRSFDTILMFHVLEHLPSPEKTLQVIGKLLKPGGHFFMVVPNPEGIGHRLKGKKWVGFTDPTHVSLWGGSTWKAVLHKNNFRVIHAFSDGLWDSPYVSYLPKKMQQLLFGLPSLLQIVLGRPLLPSGLGESIALVTRYEP